MRKSHILITLLLANSAVAGVADIKLAVPKDQVLSPERRSIVLNAAERYLNRSDDTFITSLQELRNPYIDKAEVETVEKPQFNETIIVYDKASILKVIGSNFSKQVRGTLARGDIHYLQLQGGGLMKMGSKFPAEVPQIKDQSFIVTISNVSSRGYTLEMDDAILEVPFETTTGITKD